mmetsp:Transcript_24686/g.71192  ORF Transcript_24686/g.71192 Transcript_24686/m.71192 type:complete len:327 (-) Transcript_24686:807-1787(-)
MHHKIKTICAIIPNLKYKFFLGCLQLLVNNVADFICLLIIPIVLEECILDGIVEIASLDLGSISTPLHKPFQSRRRGISIPSLRFGRRRGQLSPRLRLLLLRLLLLLLQSAKGDISLSCLVRLLLLGGRQLLLLSEEHLSKAGRTTRIGGGDCIGLAPSHLALGPSGGAVTTDPSLVAHRRQCWRMDGTATGRYNAFHANSRGAGSWSKNIGSDIRSRCHSGTRLIAGDGCEGSSHLSTNCLASRHWLVRRDGSGGRIARSFVGFASGNLIGLLRLFRSCHHGRRHLLLAGSSSTAIIILALGRFHRRRCLHPGQQSIDDLLPFGR